MHCTCSNAVHCVLSITGLSLGTEALAMVSVAIDVPSPYHGACHEWQSADMGYVAAMRHHIWQQLCGLLHAARTAEVS